MGSRASLPEATPLSSDVSSALASMRTLPHFSLPNPPLPPSLTHASINTLSPRHTHTHTHTHPPPPSRPHPHQHTLPPTKTHTHTHTPPHTHTHTHTHIHTLCHHYSTVLS